MGVIFLYPPCGSWDDQTQAIRLAGKYKFFVIVVVMFFFSF